MSLFGCIVYGFIVYGVVGLTFSKAWEDKIGHEDNAESWITTLAWPIVLSIQILYKIFKFLI